MRLERRKMSMAGVPSVRLTDSSCSFVFHSHSLVELFRGKSVCTFTETDEHVSFL